MFEIDLYRLIYVMMNFILVTMFVLTFSTKSNEHVKYLSGILFAVIISGILSLRDKSVTLDTPKYIKMFENSDLNSFFNLGVYEIGFIFFNQIVRFIFNEYPFFLFLVTFIHIYIMIIVYRKFDRDYYLIMLAIYLSTFTFWISNLSMLRQGLAIPFVVLGIYYLFIEKRVFRVIILVILASSLHLSSLPLFLINIILYAIYSKIVTDVNKGFRHILPLVIIGLIVYPENLFSNLLIYFLILISKYVPFFILIDKIFWYISWQKLIFWKVKHVYYLLLIFYYIFYIHCNDKNYRILFTIAMSFLAFFKLDEMFTDRIFMYYFPLVPVFIVHFFKNIGFIDRKVAVMILFLGVLVWFNVKLMYLQYPNWFIYPYESVR